MDNYNFNHLRPRPTNDMSPSAQDECICVPSDGFKDITNPLD